MGWAVAPLPDFITSARRELMLSAAFLAFFGAIVARYSCVLSREGCYAPARWLCDSRKQSKQCGTVFALSILAIREILASMSRVPVCGRARKVGRELISKNGTVR